MTLPNGYSILVLDRSRLYIDLLNHFKAYFPQNVKSFSETESPHNHKDDAWRKQVEGELFLSLCKIVLCPAEILAHQIQFSFNVAFNVMKGSRRQNVAVYITRLPLLKERLKKSF